MIFFLVTIRNSFTGVEYFETLGKNLSARPRLLFYEHLTSIKRLPAGTYIFADIELLSPAQAELAAKVWQDLASSQEQVRLLNHPTRSMRRYELLRTLYERGSNKFNVYRLAERRAPQSLPVFLRSESEHSGNLTPLLYTEEEIENAIREFWDQGKSREDTLIAEFCDTSDDIGVFRKYSAFIIGEHIIPTHLFFSQHWMTKLDTSDQHTTENMLMEERRYIEGNPHEGLLREIAKLAHIDYGRIDYSVLNGEIQIWEINTNPMLLRRSVTTPARVPLLEYAARRLNAAFEAIDCKTNPKTQINISVQPDRLKRFVNLAVEILPLAYRPYLRRKSRDWDTSISRLFSRVKDKKRIAT